jgi:AAA domain
MTTDRQRELAAQAVTQMEAGNDESAVMLQTLAGPAAMAEIIGDDDDDDTAIMAASQGRRVGQFASEIEELPQEWVWPGWIPQALVGMFAGDAGIGKSSVLRDLIRRVTRGEPLPDGQPCEPMGVILISYEEPSKTVLIPRLWAAGCDLTKVKILSTVTPSVRKLGEPAERPFRVPEDLELLREAIEDDQANIGLVIIDPVLSISDKALGHNQTVRRLLGQLQQVAQDTSAAILLVAHLIKGNNPSIRQRMNGAKAFYDYPRFVMAAAQDESNPKRASLWMDKHSLAGDVASLTYQRTSTGVHFVDGHIEAARANYAQEEELRTDQLILRYLAARPADEFQARQIAFGVHCTNDATRQQLVRLVAAGRITRTTRGYYRALVTDCHKSETAQQAEPAGVAAVSQPVTTADDKTVVLDDKTLVPTTILAPTNGARPVPMR